MSWWTPDTQMRRRNEDVVHLYKVHTYDLDITQIR